MPDVDNVKKYVQRKYGISNNLELVNATNQNLKKLRKEAAGVLADRKIFRKYRKRYLFDLCFWAVGYRECFAEGTFNNN